MTTDDCPLLKALRTIAAIPLWGEPMTDVALKAEYIDTSQYDVGEDAFNPCVDTESSYLQDAVETARKALAAGRASMTKTCPKSRCRLKSPKLKRRRRATKRKFNTASPDTALDGEARKDVYERITARIVAQLEQGVKPWSQPWKSGESG